MILTCVCKHADQDAIHGAQRRVHNRVPPGDRTAMALWRCTVCGRERPAKQPPPQRPKPEVNRERK